VETSVEDVVAQSMIAGGSGTAVLILVTLGVFGLIGLMVATCTATEKHLGNLSPLLQCIYSAGLLGQLSFFKEAPLPGRLS
jgi:hypothetical protein